MTVHLRLLVAFLVVVLGCRSQQDTAGKQDEGDQAKLAVPKQDIPPNHCRIIGTVVLVNESLSANPDDPCAKSPCLAKVRIDEIVGYGSAFGAVLAKGQEVSIRFRFTLGPTRELLPSVTPPLEGLKVGSRFEADIQGGGAPMMGEQSASFVVDHYSLR